MKKLHIIVITLVLCASFIVYKSSPNVVSQIKYTQSAHGTEMQVDISPNKIILSGSEFWLKDEKIIFKLKSQKNIEVEIGICPTKENGQSNYDEMVSQVVDISDIEKEITLTVPNDSQYCLFFFNKTNKNISFNAFINRTFKESLV